MIFHWPEQLSSYHNDARVASLVDVMPTILSLLQIPVPETVQGKNLSDVLKNPGVTTDRNDSIVENAAFIEGFFPQIGVRTPTQLYGMEMIGEAEPDRKPSEAARDRYFFDMKQDPFQMKNLAEKTDTAGTRTILDGFLRQWHETTPRKNID